MSARVPLLWGCLRVHCPDSPPPPPPPLFRYSLSDFVAAAGVVEAGEDRVLAYLNDVFLPTCVWSATAGVFTAYVPVTGEQEEGVTGVVSDAELWGLSMLTWEEEEAKRRAGWQEKQDKSVVAALDHHCPIPDPTVSSTSLTPGAIERSHLCVRRTRLAASAAWVCGGWGVPLGELVAFCEQVGGWGRQPVPVWWQPGKDDVALVVGVARFGLHLDLIFRSLFDKKVILGLVRGVVGGAGGEEVGGEEAGGAEERVNDIRTLANEFVSFRALEERVGRICAHFSKARLDPNSTVDAPHYFTNI